MQSVLVGTVVAVVLQAFPDAQYFGQAMLAIVGPSHAVGAVI